MKYINPDYQQTPILLIIFNRPEKTKLLFEVINKIEPLKLYITADGPREGNISDIELCEKTREVVSNISWNCSLKTLFREKNLGCKEAVSSAITWFFSCESEGIILEDDCIPLPDFFLFCTELLEKYRDDKRIMMISGDNFLFSKYLPEESYYFSQQTHIWGWATWKRAWDYYDIKMKSWPEIKNKKLLKNYYPDKFYENSWLTIMEKTFNGEIQTWDYQWQYTCWTQNGLCIMPSKNLVLNIGNDSEGTHYCPSEKNNPRQSLNPIAFPLIHPVYTIRDYYADYITLQYIFPKNGKFQNIYFKLKIMIKQMINKIKNSK